MAQKIGIQVTRFDGTTLQFQDISAYDFVGGFLRVTLKDTGKNIRTSEVAIPAQVIYRVDASIIKTP